MIRSMGLAAVVMVLTAPAAAGAQSYSFEVNQKFVNIAFESRMEIEDIFGSTHAVKGWLKLDSKGGGTFRLEVPVDSLRTGIDLRDEHLRSAMWLDAARHPSLVFEGRSIKKLGRDRYLVGGTFSMRGREQPLKVTVTARPIGAELAAKLGMDRANWVRVRGSFAVRLSDHGVKIPSMAAAKVNDSWNVRFSLFAREVR